MTSLHDTAGPSGEEQALVFDQVYRRRYPNAAMPNARAYAWDGVETIRERVFPVHGIG